MSFAQYINFKAIGFGAILFFIMYLLILYCSNSESFTIYNSNNLFWLNLIGISIFVFCGYLTASIAKRFGVLNALFLGLLTPIFIIIGMSIVDGPTVMFQALKNNLFKWNIASVILCVSGGLAWHLKMKLRHVNP